MKKNIRNEIGVLPYFCDILWKVSTFILMSHVLLPCCVCWRFLKHKSGTVYKLSIFQLHKTAFFTDAAFLSVVWFWCWSKWNFFYRLWLSKCLAMNSFIWQVFLQANFSTQSSNLLRVWSNHWSPDMKRSTKIGLFKLFRLTT